MSSPGLSGETNKPAQLFQDLWRQLGDCHRNALQELEEKVGKLKRDRCLDAQKLEVFYSRNQQLKEQNKNLQDALSLLEERLRAGECDRCATLEDNLKVNQEQNLHLIAKLKNERDSLQDENRKIYHELEKLKMSCPEPQQPSNAEQEDGIIPDSPVLQSSLLVPNRLKKRASNDKSRRLRYTEMPLPRSDDSLFRELNKKPDDEPENPGRAALLVPNTCDFDSSQISSTNHDKQEVVAETCAFELFFKHPMKTETTAGLQSGSENRLKINGGLKPGSTAASSPSLLKRFSQDGCVQKAKRKKGQSEQEETHHGIQEEMDAQEAGKHTEVTKRSAAPSDPKSFGKQPLDDKLVQNEPEVYGASPLFKKPEGKGTFAGESDGRRRNLQKNVSGDRRKAEEAERRPKVEPMWSIDPALALSMYDSEARGDEQTENQHHAELADTDCTWVSILQCREENGADRQDGVGGLGEKANDSLDFMFDTTTYGEYKSYVNSHLGQSQPCDADNDDEEEEEEETHFEPDDPDDTAGPRKAGQPTFAHMAVVRKKDERRKLKGTTCKECEIYYAHLPEEEKEKKLSNCSRHRFLYVPPSTPENFWEVGFPSTQTCIDRGYIKEDKNPQLRSRRRQPLNALFSPNKDGQEHES